MLAVCFLPHFACIEYSLAYFIERSLAYFIVILSFPEQQLQADRGHLQQQCENRSQHCMTLISENKRLAEQVGGEAKYTKCSCEMQLLRAPFSLCRAPGLLIR